MLARRNKLLPGIYFAACSMYPHLDYDAQFTQSIDYESNNTNGLQSPCSNSDAFVNRSASILSHLRDTRAVTSVYSNGA